MPRPRPGTELTEDECLAAHLSDQIDALEALQASDPYPGIEDVIDALRFVSKCLAARSNHLPL